MSRAPWTSVQGASKGIQQCDHATGPSRSQLRHCQCQHFSDRKTKIGTDALFLSQNIDVCHCPQLLVGRLQHAFCNWLLYLQWRQLECGTIRREFRPEKSLCQTCITGCSTLPQYPKLFQSWFSHFRQNTCSQQFCTFDVCTPVFPRVSVRSVR